MSLSARWHSIICGSTIWGSTCRRLAVRSSASVYRPWQRLLAELQSAPAPSLGFGWIGLDPMHPVTREDLGLERFRQPDGGLREAKIEGTREVLPRNGDVSIGQVAIAHP